MTDLRGVGRVVCSQGDYFPGLMCARMVTHHFTADRRVKMSHKKAHKVQKLICALCAFVAVLFLATEPGLGTFLVPLTLKEKSRPVIR